ncbi:PREDICTED: probable BOI-related E3 ubiquitin-protein ligase 2 [Brassica oleracea var. oleracea]|uniref:RING-type domain-containing protein n=1 Tax=Brassica oleracea var. oleracea TaxID=109376 RepID=A0A0D3CNT7_BRAOL|nr:PREDICTED: probable BOI-related E3 ubiquitin-protein ligase 2 [Brassica oleracea var. oleracea]
MALPRHLDRHLQESKNFRDFCGQISPELGFNSSTSLHDQSQHPPFHVAGFAPVVQFDGGEWNSFGRKRVKEMDFLENNSQISSIDFWQGRSVSTGLGLSLDSPPIGSSDGSALLPLDVERELQRQDAEIDRFLKIQGDQLRHAVLDKIQRSQYKTVALMEERVVQKLREKDEELEMVNRTNKELELRIEQLAMEAEAWQQRANYNENMVAALNYNLERAHGRPRDSIEGCGDSEVDDTASCFNRRNGKMMCRFCGVREVCMLLLPCKHMCLCKECERNLSSCPLCQSSKFLGMEVYM